MIIIIKNIPVTTTTSELLDFGRNALKISPWLPFETGHIVKIDTFTKRFSTAPYFVTYGMIIFDSKKSGLRAIRRLNGKKIKNNIVEVREYIMRSANNHQNCPETKERRGSALTYEGPLRSGNIFDHTNVYEPIRRAHKSEDRLEKLGEFSFP